MKNHIVNVYYINRRGLQLPYFEVVDGVRGKRLILTHGEGGRNRWELRYIVQAPSWLNLDEFSYEDRKRLAKMAWELVPLDREDRKGNRLYLLRPTDQEPDAALLLVETGHGFRGGGSYKVIGEGEVIGKGQIADGLAGRMADSPCPAILATGPVAVKNSRWGRLYGDYPDWWVFWQPGDDKPLVADGDTVREEIAVGWQPPVPIEDEL